MIVGNIQWDDENVAHIARHNVNPQEVEDICFGLHIGRKESNQRYILGGQTATGRYLNIVIERVGKSLFRPITAFEMSENYKSNYRKRFRE